MNTIISVVIPVYNNPSGLLDTLKSLVVQNYKDFEIIVVDNGSADNTFKTAEDFAKRFPETIKVATENNIQSSYAARNKGIKISRGSIIAFIDADMTVEKNWLRKIVETFNKNTKIDYLGCRVDVCLNSKNIFELYDEMVGFPIKKYITHNNFVPTCCLIVRKTLFNKVGLFDHRLISSGDYEFGNRVFEAGYKLYYEPKIVMKHPAREILRQLLKRYFRIARGFRQLFFYYPVRYGKFDPNNEICFRSCFLPNPWKFYNFNKRNGVWNKVSFNIKIGFYIINYAIKLAKYFGYIYENQNIKNKSSQY